MKVSGVGCQVSGRMEVSPLTLRFRRDLRQVSEAMDAGAETQSLKPYVKLHSFRQDLSAKLKADFQQDNQDYLV